MQLFMILCVTVAVCANHSLPYDVYVGRGGLPLPEILRKNDSWFIPENKTIITPHIRNGYDPTAGQFPWMVALFRSYGFNCGGSLINRKTILTAAHCVIGAKPFDLYIKVGSLKRSEGSMVNVSEIKIHRLNDDDTIDYDIALLITIEEIPIDDKNVKPISLGKQEPSKGMDVLIAGWEGTHKERVSETLQYAYVNIVDRKTCESKYGDQPITNRMICAGNYWKDSNTCKGDSGGPLIHNHVQVGVVSWGVPCSKNGYPNVYTNVVNLLPWINSNKAKNIYKSKESLLEL